jgi:diphthamide biosynthesis protein 2
MFDTLRVGDLIRESGFKTIALQFPDEFLGHCATIYDRLLDSLADLDVEIFIVGDSTFGSSVDDISALHVDSDLLVYFGSDLSSSGSMPVIVAPFLKNMEDCASCANNLHQAASVENAVDVASKTLILYEPAYHRQIDEVARQLSLLLGSQTIKASMPPSADLTSWTPERSMKKQISSDGSARLIGGLLVPNEVLSEQNLTVYYIGEKHEQLTSITLQVSGSPIVAYSPQSGEVAVHNGSTSRDFRERYGGVSRVKDANIIGIIIGSMGLSEDLTRRIVDRLEALISTARKSSYLFVMGRLNEAKLCNFPEVGFRRLPAITTFVCVCVLNSRRSFSLLLMIYRLLIMFRCRYLGRCVLFGFERRRLANKAKVSLLVTIFVTIAAQFSLTFFSVLPVVAKETVH